jgi:hypothetical protein
MNLYIRNIRLLTLSLPIIERCELVTLVGLVKQTASRQPSTAGASENN